MQEITVKYLLTDEEVERLQKIIEEYKKLGKDLTIDKWFEKIMITGSRYDIDDKFTYYEKILGLREWCK